MVLAPSSRVTSHRIGAAYAMSVDRVRCGDGYVPGNVVLCCNAVNLFKNALSVEDFLRFAEAVASRSEVIRCAHG